MTTRHKRTPQIDLSLTIKDDEFIAAPRERQRNWLITQALDECSANLEASHHLAAKFVPGVEHWDVGDREFGDLSDEEIMEDWQTPIMKAMAQLLEFGDVLEIGFGRGIGSTFLQEQPIQSHTIVEVNQSVIARCEEWKKSYPERDIRIVPGRWQDVMDQLGQYDGIFFHTYPLSQEEFVEQIAKSVTFGEHFFPTAKSLLRKGGAFTYLSNEIDSLSRSHQRLLLDHFSSFSVSKIEPLNMPQNVRDAWWADSMVLIKAVR